ncbi:MAG: hypothetical protein MI922_01200, partial [Bacteroidales bacterium]|nr:hypothetical protein [Bacteroidales bacterium]
DFLNRPKLIQLLQNDFSSLLIGEKEKWKRKQDADHNILLKRRKVLTLYKAEIKDEMDKIPANFEIKHALLRINIKFAAIK